MRKKRQFDILTLAFAFVISVLLWFYVIGVQDPVISETFYDVKINTVGADDLYENNGFTVMSTGNTTVNVRLSGKRSELIRVKAEDIYVEADLSQINAAGENSLQCTVTPPESSLTVDNRTELRLLVNVDVRETKNIPVKLVYTADLEDNEIIGDNITLSPSSIKITGAASELDTIVSATVEVGTVITDSFSADMEYYYADANGNAIETQFTSADADRVKVNLPVLVQKTVDLEVHKIEGGGLTKDNVIVEIQPKQITIAGEKSVMDGIDSITIKDLELEDLTKSVTTTEVIPLDEGLVNMSGVATATVKVSIENTSSKIMIIPATQVSVMNVPAGYTCELKEQDIQLSLWGGNSIVSAVKNSNVQLVADLQGMTSSGSYTVELKISFQDLDVAPRVNESYKVTVILKQDKTGDN